MAKFQLHVSGLNMLSRCGEQFRRRYVDGAKVAPGIAALIGTATDRSVMADLRNKIDAGELLPDEAVKDVARDALIAEWEKGVVLDDDYAALGPKKAKALAVDKSVTLASLHHKEAAPSLEPTHLQREWVMDVQGLPIQLAGTIDIQEGARAIRDLKTSKKSPARDEADRSLQLTTYALAAHRFDGRTPERVGLTYLVHTKTPKLVRLESRRTEEDFPHLVERIYQASRIIESGLFMPAPIDAWWCSVSWCGFHATCPYAARRVTVAVDGGEE